jgi:hypothetical protein
MPETRPRIRRRTQTTLLEAMADANLFAPWFRDPTSWAAWRSFIATLFALPLSAEELAIYQHCTGRRTPPTTPHREAWLVCGRRSGKSFMLALIATFLACFHDFTRHLTRGERATVMIVCADRKQARVVLRYIGGLLHGTPLLAPLIERETAESFDLRNRISIEVATASFKTVRGYAICAALLDELAFWAVDDDAASPDSAVIAAIRPATLTIPNAMLLCASSPYARKGALWDAHRRHFGQDADPVLVWQAPTRQMNPTVSEATINEELERDPASASAEYLAMFRSDVEGYVNLEVVKACISNGVYERAPQSGISYHAFVDPSGGSADSMTLCVAHFYHPGRVVIVDAVREVKPPFSPEAVVVEFASLLQSYKISTVVGDKYAGEWPREQFLKHGILYESSAAPKSDLYRDLLPLLNSLRIHLLDHSKLVNQLTSLERRTARGGRDSIDHPPGGHDDIANCIAGASAVAVSKHGTFDSGYAAFQPDFQDADATSERVFDGRAFRTQQLYTMLNGMVWPR